MIYQPPISLIPHGAFMICEDATEDNPYVPVQMEPITTDQAIEKTSEFVEDEPIRKIIYKSMPIFDNIVSKWMTWPYDFDPNNTDGMIQGLEELATGASTALNHLRKIITKVHALHMLWDRDDVMYEGADRRMGKLLVNSNILQKQGFNERSYQYRSFPGIDPWFMKSLVRHIINQKELLGTILYVQNIVDFTGIGSEDIPAISDTVDFLNMLFKDPARITRLEQIRTRTVSLRDILSHEHNEGCNTGCDDPIVNGNNMLYSSMLCLLSEVLKYVSVQCYDLQCRMLDGEDLRTEYEHCVKTMLCKLINTYSIGMMYAVMEAYELMKHIAEAFAINTFVDDCINCLQRVNSPSGDPDVNVTVSGDDSNI